MTKLATAVLTVSVDEPAVRLTETVRRVLVPTPNGGHRSEEHRIQSISVLRDGEIVRYTEDLGLASQYRGEAFVLLADFEPVGELLDMAFARRHAMPLNIERGIAPPDLIGGYFQQTEERWKTAHRVGTFGPHFRKQRDLHA